MHLLWLSTVLLAVSKSSALIDYFDDSEDTLSQEPQHSDLEEIADGSKKDLSHWSSWSKWTTCSRSCDGGITLSLRTCSSKSSKIKLLPVGKGSECIGEPIRRRICSMHPCPEPTDFRASQCAAYDTVPYRGQLYAWLPFYDPEDPCTLTCQAKGYNFVAKLSTKVQDGTRCREGALDMCVQGQCKPVGCDLEVGSVRNVDECGVCGGDGTGCASAPAFAWSPRPFQPCPVTCGGGVQVSEPACLQKHTEQQVDPRLCDHSVRPRTQKRPCNQFSCPVVWQAEEWGPCSATCGVGVQTRELHCVQGGINGTQMSVKNEFCPRHKPAAEKSCETRECPRWFQGAWSACSATCDGGVQRRPVVCRDERGHYSESCDESTKPELERPCNEDPCPPVETTTPAPCIPETTFPTFLKPLLRKTTTSSTTSAPRSTIYATHSRATWRPTHSSLPKPIIAFTVTAPTTTTSTASTTSTSTATTTTTVTTTTTTAPATTSRSFQGPVFGSFHVGPWSGCSSTCGPGHRRRLVQCQIFLEFSRNIAVLPDSHCSGARPLDIERCNAWCVHTVPSSTPSPTLRPATRLYVWESTGEFPPCSITCLTEYQAPRVICVRRAEGTEAPSGMCDAVNKPSPKSCQNICTTRWNVSDFGECSVTCGGGVRTRRVQCVQETVSGVLVAADEKCAEPAPSDRELCNVVECPPKWKAEPWSKCSRSCGGGFQTRKLRCEIEIGHPTTNRTVAVSPSKCLKARPKASKPCNRKPCLGVYNKPKHIMAIPITRTTTTITTTSTTTDDQLPSEETIPTAEEIELDLSLNDSAARSFTTRKVFTKAFGVATVYKGAILKVHCPISFDHANDSLPPVLWFKGRRRFSGHLHPEKRKNLRVIVSSKNALKIRKVNFLDAGTYTCLAGPVRSDLELKVHPLPPGGFTEESSTGFPGPKHGESSTVQNSVAHSAKPTSIPMLETGRVTKEDTSNAQIHQVSTENQTSNETRTELTALADGSDDTPKFLWKTGAWSPCSRSCGTEGIQVRTIECVGRLRSRGDDDNNRVIKIAGWTPTSGALCVEQGLLRPQTAKACSTDPCPKWVAGAWSKCSSRNCVSWNTAYQKRIVRCDGNGSCGDKERPRRKRECFQPACKSLWRTGPWSQCTATCGDRGLRTRRVECVWYGSGWPAGASACRHLDVEAPLDATPCKGPPCTKKLECINQSTYCEIVKKTKLCRMSHFRLQCCASCTTSEDPTLSD